MHNCSTSLSRSKARNYRDVKYSVLSDDECETEPQPAHPCDGTFFPDAAPIADEACDVLKGMLHSALFCMCGIFY